MEKLICAKMNYLGICHDYNFPNSNSPRLFTYINNDVDVVINYNEQCPFYIEQIAVLLERTDKYRAYDVFECWIEAKTDVEAKEIARSFDQNLQKYRKSFAVYMSIPPDNLVASTI